MSRVMLLVDAEGVTLAETRIDEGEDARAETLLREEAIVSGFTEAEVASAHVETFLEPVD